MKSRRRNSSYPPNTRSITLRNGRGNSLPISIDLVMETFSWLPAKSIATCRCVSKLWSAVIGRPDFTELFLTRSSTRPQLMFAFENKDGFVFFSSQQPQNPCENSSSAVTANRLTQFSSSDQILDSSNGFFLLKGMRNPKVLFNPSTGQSLTLPEIKPKTKSFVGKRFLGYDPIEKQFKVLLITLSRAIDDEMLVEYQILTLGIIKPSWRVIECCIPPHYSMCKGICINGVLYYVAYYVALRGKSNGGLMIACFDFHSEKFSFINAMEAISGLAHPEATFINYNGKLGLLISGQSNKVNATSTSFTLWVLQDLEKQEWSKHVYLLPPLWKNVVGEADLLFLGVIGTNEVVFSPQFPSAPSYVVYYNIDKATVVRVAVQGMEAFNGNIFHTFVNHVENVKLIQSF